MKKTVFGLCLFVFAAFLMCAAMVSSPEGEEAYAERAMLPAAPCAVLPARQEPAPQETEGGAREPVFYREAALSAGRFLPPRSPSADANGVPVLKTAYRRCNFMAFHFSDEAG